MHEFGTLLLLRDLPMMKATIKMLIRLLPFDVRTVVQVPSFQIGMSLAVQILQCVREWKQIVVWLLLVDRLC
jgi:hypothetical protein